VPAGLYYTWKRRFRSSVLLSFGQPIAVPLVALEGDGEPPADAVRDLTQRLEESLSVLTLQAESQDVLDLVRRAERVFAEEDGGPLRQLSAELELRRRFVEGYRRLAERDPRRLAAIEERIARFDAERKAAGLSLETLTPRGLDAMQVMRLLLRN